MEYSLVFVCLSICLGLAFASIAEYDRPLGFYGVPDTDSVYYESYGPDEGPLGGSLSNYYNTEYENGYKDEEKKGYSYEYGVNDPHTGDRKKAWEVKIGNVVKGGYSLIEPDGTERIVEYTADDVHGFQAVVKKIGPNYYPGPAIVPYEKPYPRYGFPVQIPAAPIPLEIPVYRPVYKDSYYDSGAYDIETYH